MGWRGLFISEAVCCEISGYSTGVIWASRVLESCVCIGL